MKAKEEGEKMKKETMIKNKKKKRETKQKKIQKKLTNTNKSIDYNLIVRQVKKYINSK